MVNTDPMASTVANPLEWDLEVIYPSLESDAYQQAVGRFRTLVKALDDDLTVAEQGTDAGRLAGLFERMNAVRDQQREIGAYIHGRVTTNTRDEAAQAAMSAFDTDLLPLEKLQTRFAAWVGSLPEGDTKRPELEAYQHAIYKARVESQHQMSPAEESLAADLMPSGPWAWEKLHGNLTSQIQVDVDLPSGRVRQPMSVVRTMAYDPDRAVRQAAYEAELRTWKEHEVPVAAAMNGLKGSVVVLAKRRGWGSPLDEALFSASIDRETLEAMMSAAHESFPDFRRYMRAKAKALGIETMRFYDLFAPLGGGSRKWTYEEGMGFVRDQFGRYSQKLADYAQRNFEERWIDVMPKPGKVDGAYCMGVRKDESRILMNFKPSFGSVSTLAHELGHGYHNLCLADREPINRTSPMTLAETASIFCETIIRRAALQDADDSDRLTILEASLQGACQVVVDITSRFLFESAVFERRADRDLSATELCDAMVDAQRKTYGDGFEQGYEHPYMWAVKPHYYSTSSFYNFPYMFGLLFGLGLYAIYEKEPNGFHARYDELLSSTGMADAATLAARFGIDIRKPEFWRASLDQIRTDIDAFERLVS